MATIVILGASGTMGGLVAREAIRKDFLIVLAGRQADPLLQLASSLPAGSARAAIVDIADPTILESVIEQADVVVNTVGPFSQFAEPVISACLQSGTSYVDLANELSAVRALLERDAEARLQGVQLVTGAGFGVVATETLALMLAQASAQPLRSIQVAAAPAVAYASKGVQATIAHALAQGSPRYVDGRLVVGALGEGATTFQFVDGPRQVIPAPTGDLIAAQRATGAPDAVAYVPVPGDRSMQPDEKTKDFRSVAMARGCTADGTHIEADLTFGEGDEASAAIAVEVALRTVANPRPGAWTPGQLFGPQLAKACGAVVHGPRP
jgi:saccharopine dehydrogenase (NAD+, L-lysine-forming)